MSTQIPTHPTLAERIAQADTERQLELALLAAVQLVQNHYFDRAAEFYFEGNPDYDKAITIANLSFRIAHILLFRNYAAA